MGKTIIKEPQAIKKKTTANGKRGLSPIYLDEIEKTRPPVVVVRSKKKRIIAFGWYGGKFSHLDWLLPLLPKVHHYCEPFSGSAAILLNRDTSPVETYNDIDGDVVNFFRVLRDRRNDLKKTIALTPFSREEYYQAIYGSTKGLSDLERARKFYIRARQTRTGLAQTATLGRWANCRDTSRTGMSGAVSRWLRGIEALDLIALRLLTVQIENRPAIDVIQKYDSPRTFFYCDPPYVHESRTDKRAYGFELDEEQHRELAVVLRKCKGKVALSGYECSLMSELYSDWKCHKASAKLCHSSKRIRRETLWTNY